MGQKGRIRVTFSNPVATGTDVMLTSGSTATATVPDHITVPAGAVSAEAPYMGVAPGSVVFRATAAGETQVTTTTVVDILRVTATSGPTFEVGAHGLLSQNVNIRVPEALTLSLASSQASTATVDSTVTIPAFSSTGVAQITAVSPGISQITVGYNGQQATQTVTVIDKARIAQAYGPNLIEVGGHDTVQIYLTAQLAKATDIEVASSDPSVISIAPSYTLAAGSDFTYLDLQAVAPGSTNLQLSLNGSVENLPIAVVSKAQLESVRLSGIPSAGYSAQLTVFMDVAAATAHDVTLTSSDPNVVTVPSKITVLPGTSSASTPVTLANTGDAVITATHNGISRQTVIHVGTSGYTLGFYGSSRQVVGTLGQLSIQGDSTPTTVNLVSSDPSVVSVPSSIVVSYSEVAPVTALHTGTATITASTANASATFPITVVASPAIQQFGPSFNLPINGEVSSYLYLDTQAPLGTIITFSTSNAAIAPAPASISVGDSQTYIPITIRGGNTGTAIVTATVAGTTASAVVYVGSVSNGVFTDLFPNASTLEIGAATVVNASFASPPPNGDTGTITFGTPGILSTPSTTLAISPNNYTSYFPVTGAVAGSSDVTVTMSGVSQTTTILVVSSPTYTLQLPGTAKINATVSGSIFSNAVVAADRTFALSSSNPNVAAVTATAATISPGRGSQQASFGVRGVAPGTATITASIKGTDYTANITVQ